MFWDSLLVCVSFLFAGAFGCCASLSAGLCLSSLSRLHKSSQMVATEPVNSLQHTSGGPMKEPTIKHQNWRLKQSSDIELAVATDSRCSYYCSIWKEMIN